MMIQQTMPGSEGAATALSAVEKQHKLLLETHGGDIPELLHRASRLLGAPLFLWDEDGVPLAAYPPQTAFFAEGRDAALSAALLAAPCVRLEDYAAPAVFQMARTSDLPCDSVRMELPLGQAERVGGLAAFATEHSFAQEDIAFFALAGSILCAQLRRARQETEASHMGRLHLMKQLLQYKPGLRPVMVQRIYMEHLHELTTPFRVIYFDLAGRRRSSPESYCALLGQSLEGTWTFMDGDRMLCVFNEALINPAQYQEALAEFLRAHQLCACVSAPFDSLLDLKRQYEIAQDCFSIAARKEPEKRLFFAEEYMLLSFLAKCQRHFALDAYYPSGLKKLIAAQSALGYDALHTLHTYFNCHCSVNATANTLYVHRNTALHLSLIHIWRAGQDFRCRSFQNGLGRYGAGGNLLQYTQRHRRCLGDIPCVASAQGIAVISGAVKRRYVFRSEKRLRQEASAALLQRQAFRLYRHDSIKKKVSCRAIIRVFQHVLFQIAFIKAPARKRAIYSPAAGAGKNSYRNAVSVSGAPAIGNGRFLPGCCCLGLYQAGLNFGPVIETILQGVHLGNVITDRGKGVGAGLGISFAGIANQNNVFVKALGSGRHGCLAGFGIAVLGSVHVGGYGTSDMAGFIIGSLTHVEYEVILAAEYGFQLVGSHVLHGNVARRGGGFLLGTTDSDYHRRSKNKC